jgi:hypothetical protein
VDRVDEIKRASAMVRRLVKDENADRVSDETLLREMKRVLALLEDLEHSAKYAVVKAAVRRSRSHEHPGVFGALRVGGAISRRSSPHRAQSSSPWSSSAWHCATASTQRLSA